MIEKTLAISILIACLFIYYMANKIYDEIKWIKECLKSALREKEVDIQRMKQEVEELNHLFGVYEDD